MEQDIQLSGLGIQQQHATIDIENSEVFVTPLPNARFEIIPTLPVSFLLCFGLTNGTQLVSVFFSLTVINVCC